MKGSLPRSLNLKKVEIKHKSELHHKAEKQYHAINKICNDLNKSLRLIVKAHRLSLNKEFKDIDHEIVDSLVSYSYIIYARVFNSNSQAKLNIKDIVNDTNLIKLHKDIVTVRNQHIAHNDNLFTEYSISYTSQDGHRISGINSEVSDRILSHNDQELDKIINFISIVHEYACEKKSKSSNYLLNLVRNA